MQAALRSFTAGPPAPTPTPKPVRPPNPAPTPSPSPLRTRLLVDPRPPIPAVGSITSTTGTTGAAVAVSAGNAAGTAVASKWIALASSTPQAARLRTASSYLATHLSAQFDLAPVSAGSPVALQIADGDLFAPGAGAAAISGPGSKPTGFDLLWDGTQWRLQYRQTGTLAADVPLSGIPALPDESSSPSDWYRVEVALEPRSAAAWVWPAGTPRPEQPNAVFAPPESAISDAARPRYLFLPDHPIENLVFEGATRDS
jgi:hypothetical protein